MATYFIQQLINGFAAGSIYALIAVGYNMVYGMLELINFAHGDIYMFGTFIALSLLVDHFPVPIAIVLACLAGGLTGVLVERVAYRPVRNAPRVVPMLSAVGAALVLRNVAQLIWGTSTRPFPELFPTHMIAIGGINVNSLQIIIMFLALGLTGIFALIMNKTKLGKATHCVAQDIPAAKLMGIEVNWIITFGLPRRRFLWRSRRHPFLDVVCHLDRYGLPGYDEGLDRLHHWWHRQPEGGVRRRSAPGCHRSIYLRFHLICISRRHRLWFGHYCACCLAERHLWPANSRKGVEP